MWRQASFICGILGSSTTASRRQPWQQLLLFSTSIVTASSNGSSPGLFGIGRLQSQGDFPRWAEDAKERCVWHHSVLCGVFASMHVLA